MGKPPKRQSKVPTSRLARLFRFGIMAGELTVGGILEGVRRLADDGPGGTGSVFLNVGNAQKLARRLSHMRGAAMKLGQLLSMEGEDLLPREFAEALALLRSGANTMPVPQLRRLLGREYGKGWEKRFAEFDFEPLAAASIGQVHVARAADGRRLALKIQYPGVAQSINSDVNNVATLLRLLNFLPVELNVAGLVAEAKQQLKQEADYLQEARFMNRYRSLVADEPAFQVPRVHQDLTTKRIIAMDFVQGHPFEVLAESQTPQVRRDRAGTLLERLLFRELFEFRFMQTDPNFANYLYQPDTDPTTGRIVLLDFGSAQEFPAALAANYARISRAIIAGDRRAVGEAAIAIGYLSPEDPEYRVRGVVDLICLICEPLRHHGPYDFAGSKLAARARDIGFDLAFRQGYLRPPPPETTFLHRKLVGSFLLCARIHARVDVQGLISPFLQERLTV